MILAVFVVGCGDLSDLYGVKQLLNIEIVGVYRQPNSAEGNSDPKFIDVDFQGLDLIRAEDDEVISIKPVSENLYRVISRPQLIVSQNFSDYELVEFSNAQLKLGPSITIGGKYGEDYSVALSSDTVDYGSSFQQNRGRGLKVVIQLYWRNIIDCDKDSKTEVVNEPEFVINITS